MDYFESSVAGRGSRAVELHSPRAPVDANRRTARNASGTDQHQGTRERVRVDGKLFSRGDARFRVSGVTYGPFAPNSANEPFPSATRTVADVENMAAAGINTIRTYHQPPTWLLEAAGRHGMQVFVDVPWPKHLCFLESVSAQRDAHCLVRKAAAVAREYPCLFACSVGNEIPSHIVRWHGARKIERFLAELYDVAKQASPESLVTYANYPPTEYLDLSCFDFVTYNVYLHDRDVFRRYLQRLQNLAGDKPLVLGELGMDTFRHGELGQADFLNGHLREVTLMGLAGAFVFSWTDDWHTGGHPIEDWAFGITDRARQPKPAYHAVREVFESPPVSLLADSPKVSVIVCSYNGGRTLDQCLRSLLSLDYPNYEVLVIDDGSTDCTSEILDRFPTVRGIRQENRGLSAARNVGLYAATGSILAYTDSDCFADRDWLTLLVAQLERTGASAVGGPNLTPDDGWLAGCVAASPGQPMHVLESDLVAEHIPGCNMAFRREALLEITGFDYLYRKAGDDVDVCWRLQQAGHWITFAPGAFVWHHRRQTPRAYLHQQAGYGEAEALLRFKHPDRFNGRGDGKWNGVLYGASLQGLCLEKPLIYHGTFGTGLFQCVYQPRTAHWAMLPCTLEWHLAIGFFLLVAPLWMPAMGIAALMWFLSLIVTGLRVTQARLLPQHEGYRSRAVVMLLCYVQPLVRSWHRQKTRLLSYRRSVDEWPTTAGNLRRLPLRKCHIDDYWSEAGIERTDLLGLVIARLQEYRWSKTLDTGWQSWDLEVFGHPWAVARVATTQEEHGSGHRLVRVRYRVRPSGYTRIVWGLGCIVSAVGLFFGATLYLAAAAALLIAGCAAYLRGSFRAAAAVALVNGAAIELGLIPCRPMRSASRAEPDSTAKTDVAATPAAG